MKRNCWILFGAILSTGLLAQQVTNAPLGAPLGTSAESTNAPEAQTNPNATTAAPARTNASGSKAAPKKSAPKKKAERKKSAAAELRTVPLVPGPAVVDANHVNVRGQPKLKSEVVARLNKGEPVTVVEEITRNNSGPDEPSAWAKILLPTNAHVWVSTSFLNPSNHTVTPRKLNLRSGPGENYSVLGLLRRGDEVIPVGTKDTWTEIQAPPNAYAFIAAQYLKQEPAGPPPVAAETPAEKATVPETPPTAAPATEAPATTSPTAETGVTNASVATASTNATPPAVEEVPRKRVVQREGIVRGTVSIQAPSSFGLYSMGNGKLIDYLYTSSPFLDLRRYKGLHIVVTGEEGLEERWGNTPVITIEKIQPLEE